MYRDSDFQEIESGQANARENDMLLFDNFIF